ncbi:MAG: hypothetical protein ACLUGU_05350 [Alistipes shahii]
MRRCNDLKAWSVLTDAAAREPVSGEEHEVERFEPAAVLLRGVVPVFDLAVGGFVEFSFEKFGQQVVVDLFHKFGF